MIKKQNTHAQQSYYFPPVVTVLGHVDHGKTTLLDAVRKTNIASREHGGITQRIGASSIEISHEGNPRKITFIDTPGHEAFSLMRSRGAQAADIGLLVVSSGDGVMPQTRESIKLLQDSRIPFIVVLTKADLKNKITEKVKQQLLKEGVTLEGMGGEIPIIEVSAKTNRNITELIELILLVFDLHEAERKKLNPQNPLKAIIIESKQDAKVGPRATVVIKDGTVLVRDELLCEGVTARVRSLVDDKGKPVKSATIGEAVEVLGFEKVPPVGSVVLKKTDAVSVESHVNSVAQGVSTQTSTAGISNASSFSHHADTRNLSVIICADTLGSLEAISTALPKEAPIVLQKTGEITSADVLLAKSVEAIVVGFNVLVKPEVANLARTERVLLKNYTIIYELLNEIQDVVKGKKEALEEEIFGKAKVLASFPFEKARVLGITVLEGRVAKGDRVKLLHGEELLGESTVSSVRQGKNAVSKVESGQEAGIMLIPSLDFTIGDMLLFHR